MSQGFPPEPPPGADEVHVWQAWTDPLLRREEECARLLSPDERERAGRLLRPADRRRFVARRAAGRVLLARYAGTAPEALRFHYGEFGQPALAAPESASPLRFSLSHSAELTLLALTREAPVGVDVEKRRPIPEAWTIARDFLSARELAEIAAVPVEEQEGAFFRCWTRKEAFVKAIGEGLRFPLDAFDVSVSLPALLREVRDPRWAGTPWELHHLPLAEGFVGALAVGRAGCALSLREWDGQTP